MIENSFNNSLLEKAQEGNMDAFETIILKYERLYYSIAFRMLNNKEDAKDAVQDSLIKVYKNINKCDNIDNFKAWSCKILNNTCIDHIRSKKRKYAESIDEKLEGTDGSFEKQIESKIETPEELFMRKELGDEILEAIEKLPENFRTVIILRDLNNLTYDEIAKITDNSLGTVKSRISRARGILKDVLIKSLELKKDSNV